MVSPLAVASSAHALVVSTVSLSLSPAVAAPAESVVFSGTVSPVAAGRTVWLQRYGSSWSTVATAVTSSGGAFTASVRAGVAGSKTSWRAVARPTVTDAEATSATRTLQVVKASLALSAPSTAETGLAFTLSGSGYPVRAGRPVVVQRLSGRTWVAVRSTTESSTGRYSVPTSVPSATKYTYRAVASAWHGAAAVVSAPRVVSAHAPYILVRPSSAIAAETVTATGKLPGAYARPVWVQRRSGSSWVTLVKAKTSSTGSYSTTFRAPGVGSYLVRSLAPRVVIAGKVRAQLVTGAKTLGVVAQSASLTIPAALTQARTGAATLTFGPVRTNRVVALQVLRSGVWTTVVTGRQSSAGTASLTLTAGIPGTYSYRALAAVSVGAPAVASAARTLSVTTGPVTSVRATPAIYAIALSWTNPPAAALSGVKIRRALGATPPASVNDGTAVTDIASSATSFNDTTVTSGTRYSYALFAHSATPVYASAATVTSTTDDAPGKISGTVTAASAGAGLDGVVVNVTSVTTGASESAVTDHDGNYLVSDLSPGDDYQVCFDASGAVGPGDDYGFVDQCFDSQPASGTPTPVTVAVNTTRTDVDAALVNYAKISGTVTDATGHPLANVDVSATSVTTAADEHVTTGIDGSYTVTGVPAGTDYHVCFTGSGATGGPADDRGYVGECYDNQPVSGTPASVTTTPGATTSVSASLMTFGAISGRVTDVADHPLEFVEVTVESSTNSGGTAITHSDGSYVVTGLSAGADYEVCFAGVGGQGGSSDAYGYVDQCFDAQPAGGTPSPVTVSLGSTRTDVDAALVAFGAISGTVTDAGLHGLEHVEVSVTSESTGADKHAETGVDGSYTVTGLEAGTDYEVCFTGANATGGSSDARGYVPECFDNQRALGTATPVAVAPGATRSGADAALAIAGAISGTVTDMAHHGLSNVQVQVTSPTTTGGTATTAAGGGYTVTGLDAGTDFKVCFFTSGATGGSADELGYVEECFNNQPTWGTPTPVSAALGVTTTGVDAELMAFGAISGTVADGNAHGLSNVRVRVTASGVSSTAVTDDSGSYLVPGLDEGTDYKVCFDGSSGRDGSAELYGYVDECFLDQATSGTATPVSVTLGVATDVDAVLVAFGKITGTATDAAGAHHGLAGVRVVVTSSTSTGGSATTGEDGSYAVTGLKAGADYEVCFTGADATGGSSDSHGYVGECFGSPVTVLAAVVTPDVDAALLGAGAVSGTVADAAGAHHGLAGVQVQVTSPTHAGGTATTAADGSYTVTGLAAGTDYEVCFSATYASGGSSDGLGYLGQCFDSQPISGTPTPVTVALGATQAGVDAELAVAGAISGRVTEAGGSHHGLSNVQVHVTRASVSVGYATTADDGSYTVTGLAAGADYEVCFDAAVVGGGSSVTGYVDQCFDNQPISGTPTPVTVTLGAIRPGVDALLVAR
jgi:hypothetical protein